MRRSLLPLLVLAACGGSSPPADPPAPAPAPAVAETPPAPAPDEPVLLDAGEAPRYPLRYRIPVGTQRAMEMVMTMKMDLAGTKIETPPMVTSGPVDVHEVGRDGVLTTRWTIDDTDVHPTPTSDPTMVDTLRAELAKLEHLVLETRFSERGQVLDSQLLTPAPTAELQQTFDNMANSTRNLVTALPVEEVGRGARWTIDDEMPSNGVTFTVHNEMELLDVTATTARIRGDVEMKAARQTLRTAAGEVPIEAVGRGQTEVLIDLTTFESDLTSNVEITMHMDVGTGQPMTMHMTMGMRMVLR